MFKQFTLGIEGEFQIVDPHTRELRSHLSEILEEGKMLLGEQVKPEMIQSMIEVGTGICKDIKETRSDITNLRGILSGLGRAKRLATSTQFSSAALQPTSSFKSGGRRATSMLSWTRSEEHTSELQSRL